MPHILSIQIPDFPVAVYRAHTPALRSRPVIVASSRRAMGRVLALSDEARQAGLRVGMRAPAAARLCPDATVLPPPQEEALRAERTLVAAATQGSPCVARCGPGQVLVDLRGTERVAGPPLDVAARLQQSIAERLDLTSVLGLARRSIWSRLAGRFVTPAGIFEVLPGQEPHFLRLIPPEWVPGVGPKTSERLRDMNITNLAMLQTFSAEELVTAFGPAGRSLANAVRLTDRDDPQLEEFRGQYTYLPANDSAIERSNAEEISILSPQRVDAVAALPQETTDPDAIQAGLARAVRTCGRALRERGRVAGRLQVTIVYSDGRTRTAGQRLVPASALDSTLRDAARQAFARARTRRIRLCRLAISCTDLRAPAGQATLFDGRAPQQERRRLRALDSIHARFGPEAIMTGTEFWARVG